MKNPFITSGYEGPEYFCDRVEETEKLVKMLDNGSNVVLMAPRRIGKTGLLKHCFQQDAIKDNYNTFLIDIYATGCLADFVYVLGKTILDQLMPYGEKAISHFVRVVTSLRPTMSLDSLGLPSWSIDVVQSASPEFTLEQIFKYLEASERPNIVAIDEFQQITYYPEKNVEAILRTHIQHCRNAVWVFSGSSRHLLSEMFSSPAHPFYASTACMSLEPLQVGKYSEFAADLFRRNGKDIDPGVVEDVYRRFEGVTWFMQRVMNRLFSDTAVGGKCTEEMVDEAVNGIVKDNGSIYADLLYQLTPRQRELLVAINKEGKASAITGGKFVKKHGLQSPSTVQTTAKALVDRQIVTNNLGVYEVYDKFFSIWLQTKN